MGAYVHLKVAYVHFTEILLWVISSPNNEQFIVCCDSLCNVQEWKCQCVFFFFYVPFSLFFSFKLWTFLLTCCMFGNFPGDWTYLHLNVCTSAPCIVQFEMLFIWFLSLFVTLSSVTSFVAAKGVSEKRMFVVITCFAVFGAVASSVCLFVLLHSHQHQSHISCRYSLIR